MRILFLDDDPGRHTIVEQTLAEHEVDHVTTAKDAISALEQNRYDIVSLDHDLGGRIYVDSEVEDTGYQVAKAMVPRPKRHGRVIIHSYNPVGAQRMAHCLRDAGIDVDIIPFGSWWAQ